MAMALEYLDMAPGEPGGPVSVLKDRIYHSGSADIPADAPPPPFPFADEPSSVDTTQQLVASPGAAPSRKPGCHEWLEPLEGCAEAASGCAATNDFYSQNAYTTSGAYGGGSYSANAAGSGYSQPPAQSSYQDYYSNQPPYDFGQQGALLAESNSWWPTAACSQSGEGDRCLWGGTCPSRTLLQEAVTAVSEQERGAEGTRSGAAASRRLRVRPQEALRPHRQRTPRRPSRRRPPAMASRRIATTSLHTTLLPTRPLRNRRSVLPGIKPPAREGFYPPSPGALPVRATGDARRLHVEWSGKMAVLQTGAGNEAACKRADPAKAGPGLDAAAVANWQQQPDAVEPGCAALQRRSAAAAACGAAAQPVCPNQGAAATQRRPPTGDALFSAQRGAVHSLRRCLQTGNAGSIGAVLLWCSRSLSTT